VVRGAHVVCVFIGLHAFFLSFALEFINTLEAQTTMKNIILISRENSVYTNTPLIP
jgi:hypothetical protein